MFFLLRISLAAEVADLAGNDSEYLVDAWTTEDGLPQNSILCMAQTPDGYLWMGTFNGLVRFDGVRFTVLNPVNTPALRSSRIIALYLDHNQALWATSEEGFVTRLADGKFEEMNGKLGLPAGALSPQGMGPDGKIWFGVGEKQLWRQTADGFVEAQLLDLSEEQFRGATASFRTAWSLQEGIWRKANYPSWLRELRAAFGAKEHFLAVPARDGDVWLVTNHAVGKLRGGMKKLPEGVTISEQTDSVEDAEGNLLIGTWTQGVMIYTRGGELKNIPLRGGPAATAVRMMMIDREGNPWVGTDLAGIQRLKRRTFHTYVRQDTRRGNVNRSITEDGEGRIWCVRSGGLDIWKGGGDFESVEIAGDTWWSVATAKDGAVWVGSATGQLCRFDGRKAGPLRKAAYVRTLVPAADGGVWVGTEAGLWHATKDSLEPVNLPAGLATRDVRAVVDEKESLWLGLMGGGVCRRMGGKWETFGAAEGLVDSHVNCLYADADGAMWVGTSSGGLSRLKDGRFKNFAMSEARMPATVLCMVEDDLGYLWLGSLNGIYRVSRGELNSFADGGSRDLVAQVYGRGDGLGTPEVSEGRQPTALKGRDGRIWFATINGLSAVDPKTVPFNPIPPPVIIEEVLVNGAPLKADAGGEFTIPALSQRVEFRYTGICLKGGTRAHFKRRLEGLENEWVDVDGERNATYYSLAPGKYRFRVMAANEDGIWNLTGASVSAVALPAWWQAWWFQAAVMILAAGLVVGAAQLRIRAADRAQAAQEAFSRQLIHSQEEERRRISAELHDGLGQALLIVKHQASQAARAPGMPAQAVEQLSRVTKSTQTAIEEVRGIVSALRPVLMDSIGLSGALSAMLEQAAQSGDVKLKWKVENMDGAIKKEHEIELFRVAQEALNNVVKHSNAANARVELRLEGARWVLEIEDDGCGFDVGAKPASGKVGGFGLNGMRERIRIAGGVLIIDSRPGQGTLLRAEGLKQAAKA